jgi:hypothetical protein
VSAVKSRWLAATYALHETVDQVVDDADRPGLAGDDDAPSGAGRDLLRETASTTMPNLSTRPCAPFALPAAMSVAATPRAPEIRRLVDVPWFGDQLLHELL